uniref:Si:dkey-7n6.2 n=1 Tax=Astyanax mexicanus TaxID=7994 RepID=A0A3B1JMV0_ASTMX
MKTSPLEGLAGGMQCTTFWGTPVGWTQVSSPRLSLSSTSTKQMRGMMVRKARAPQTLTPNQTRIKKREHNRLL